MGDELKNPSSVLAGIIQCEGSDLSKSKIVVLSTGTKNIDADALGKNALPDTHAEVVARRCLMHYFYNQLAMFLNPGTWIIFDPCLSLCGIFYVISNDIYNMDYVYEMKSTNVISFLFLSATKQKSIFEKSVMSSRLKLKDNINFHLYISKGPCGDATTFGSKGAGESHPDRWIYWYNLI